MKNTGVGRRQTQPWGFKLMNNQLHKVRVHLLARTGCRPIVLRRRNVLAVYASSEIARLTGQGSARAGDPIRRVQARFDREAFLAHHARYEAGYRKVAEALEANGRAALALDYAALSGPQGTDEHRRIADFLGVRPAAMTARTARRNPTDILSRFTNPEDARHCIAQIGHPEWAYEG